MKLFYVTSNPGKFSEAKIILKKYDLIQVNLDIAEIQGSSEEILKDKALKTAEKVKEPFIVEDVSMNMACLKGFPGPYVKSLMSLFSETELYELVTKLENDQVSTTCYCAYFDGHDFTYAQGTLHGRIVKPSGNLMHGKVSYNRVFLPNGRTKTFGDLTIEEHAQNSHRYLALTQLMAKIKSNDRR